MAANKLKRSKKNLLTLREAIAARVIEVRRNPWEPLSRLRLPQPNEHGLYGPWAKLYGSATECGAVEPASVLLLELDMDERAWEPWEDPRNG